MSNKCALTLEDLLGVVCYTQAQRRVRLDRYFSLETKQERTITEARAGDLLRDRDVDRKRRKEKTDWLVKGVSGIKEEKESIAREDSQGFILHFKSTEL